MNQASSYTIKIAETDLERKSCGIVINRAFREKQLVARKDRDMIPSEKLHQELAGKNQELYMLSDKTSGDLLGTALLTIGKDAQTDSAYIRYLAVDPTFQGRRLGRDLMRHAEDRAKAIYQKKKILLTVVYHPLHTQEKLVQWYLEQGYRYIRSVTPTEEDKRNWFEPEYHDLVKVKIFEKNL